MVFKTSFHLVSFSVSCENHIELMEYRSSEAYRRVHNSPQYSFSPQIKQFGSEVENLLNTSDPSSKAMLRVKAGSKRRHTARGPS